MKPYVIPLSDPQADLETVGGKGMSLAKLAKAGLPVPGGFHVTTEAYRQFVTANDLQSGINNALKTVDTSQPSTLETASETINRLFAQAEIPGTLANAIVNAYAELPGSNPAVAVRSSATAEDLPDASFAGQQETYLNINGAGQVLEATKKCWASLWTARAIGYRARQNIGAEGVALAVVVQEMVFAEAAGIMFTANPLNGNRVEAVINAAWGLGEAVVGGAVTPDTLTVNKLTGNLIARETAEKMVMTVRTESGTEESPVPDSLRKVPVLSDEQAVRLTQFGTKIEGLYSMPMDIEWTLADGKFAIVQARPITALPELSQPTEWTMPNPKGQYVRASIAELMPEPLTPLFATLGRAAINVGTQRLMARLGGMKEAGLAEMVVTINDYAYYTTGFTPKQLFMLLTHAPFTMPRMIRDAERYWRDVVHVRYVETIERWQARPLDELPATDILVGVRQLADASFDVYATYQSALFARANLSEMLFTRVYNKLIKRDDDPEALTYLLGSDSTPILAEESIYDIAEWCRTRPTLATYVTKMPAAHLAAQLEGSAPSGVEVEDWLEWQNRWDVHLRQFGYIIYDLDFAKPLPVDDPAPLLDTCKMFLNGQCPNPYERQQAAAERREQATQAMLGQLKGLRQKLFHKLVGWAQESVPLREEGLADLGLGYPQLRYMLRELGRRLVESAAIEQADDVFWLYQDETDQAAEALDRGEAILPFVTLVEHRKAIWHAEMRATPPPVLPPKSKWMGLDLGMFVAAEDAEQAGDTIRGAGTSPGRVTGTARVLRGPEDFGQMQPGDILVAKFTTPAWTPLFARAAAVVTDIGGQLSHGSIIAREYSIPAVMGTGVATKRIQSGQTITVDGSTGEIVLHKSEATQAPPAIEWTRPNPKGQYMRSSVADLMPNPLSPLFETLAVPTIARVGVKEVMRPLTRSEPRLPDYIVTINSYVYINGTYTFREWWWILTRMILSMPRIMREAIPLWRDKIRPHYAATVASWQDRALEALSVDELWAGIQELNEAAMLHFSSLLVATTGASAGAEMLFTNVYNKLIRRNGDPAATVFLMGYDSTPIQAEKSLYDLALWAEEHGELAAHLLETPTESLIAQLAEDRPDIDGWTDFNERLRSHLNTYGHIIYDLDFAKLLPMDDPTPMLETIKMYLQGQGVDPHERQQAAAEKREQGVESTRARHKGLRRWAFDKTLKIGQSMAQVRENALADIGLGYPTLRAMLRELGGRFVQAGSIAEAEDIFWMQADEVQSVVTALEHNEPLANLAGSVAPRKTRHAALARVTAPPMLPPKKKYLGIDMETWTPASEESQTGGMLKGIAASAGQVTAPACVLHGPEDFDRMQPGCILVAGTTTPAWTPLFAMASAVVTDIGGPLSHGSIVAREYGIPAVMGTGVATRRIQSGQTITVDGTKGEVILETSEEDQPSVAPPTEWPVPEKGATLARGSLAEHTPSPVSPLFATLGLKIANRETERLWKDFMGIEDPTSMFVGDGFYLAVNNYVYGGFRMNMKNSWAMVKMSFSTIGIMMREAPERWMAAREKFSAIVNEWERKDITILSPSDLLDGTRTVFKAACEYYTVIQSTLPAASMGEIFFTRFYNSLVKRKNDPEATTFLFGFETMPVKAELSLFDIADWLKQNSVLADYTLRTSTEKLVANLQANATPETIPADLWVAYQSRFEEHFEKFGRTAYEFDFANPTPAEAPSPQFEAIKLFIEGKAESPYQRLQTARENRGQAARSVLKRLGWPRRGWFEKLLKKAHETTAIREDSIFDMGMGHPIIRRMFAELGERFVAGGAIQTAEDIYWLEEGEVENLITALEEEEPLPDFSRHVSTHKAEWHAALQIVPPVMLPEKSFWQKFIGGGTPEEKDGKTVLKGLGTSNGQVTAPACVLYGPEDFTKMKPGDVLVATTTTPAWTPLFAMASAVVTDIGGPLSHSSIVAREYGIPAVMAARNATRHIKSGQIVTVDGKAGTVTLN